LAKKIFIARSSIGGETYRRRAASARLPAMQIPVPAAEILAVAQEYFDAGRLDAAARLAGHVLAAAPEHLGAQALTGLIALRRGRLEEAGARLSHVAQSGGGAIHWRNLSEIRRLQARLEEALGAARHAVSLDPADPLGLFQLAMVLYDRQELAPCIATARAALDLRPDLPEARMKLAQALLCAGDLQAGWPEYEWRWRIPGAPPLLPLPGVHAEWDGAPTDATVMLIADQGYGDAVMFARYLPWALSRAPGAVVAASAELHPILAAIMPGLRLFARWEDLPPFSAHRALSSMPLLAGTTLSNIPAPIPYLAADPSRAAAWRARLDGALPADARRIGLAWAGRPTHNNDMNRSVALSALAPLAAIPGLAFVALQKGLAAGQAAAFPAALLNLDPEIAGFDDTAAILAGLDLVISVDTAVIHLAGAIGVPCWVMLPFAADWRWLAGRADSPWYPGLRLFRPPAPRDWPALVAQVAAALDGWRAARQ
jgi:hypothetical protein